MERKIFITLTILFVIISITSTIFLSLKTTEVIKITRTRMVGKAVSGYLSMCLDVPPPVLDPIGDLNATIREPFSFKVNATSPSNRTVYYFDNATFFEIDNSTGWINFTPTTEDIGIYFVKISATHNICYGIEDNETINFSIAGNVAPEWNESETYDFDLTEDNLTYLNISGYVTDDDNDSINFSASPSNFPSFNLTLDGIINFTPIDEDVGFHSFNITATDGIFNVPHIFNFSVANINDMPILDYIPTPQYSCEDAVFYYDANASDDDLLIPNTTEKLYFYNSPVTLFIINEDTGEIIFEPSNNDVGNHTTEIYVTDEENYTSQDVDFVVIPVNDEPLFDPVLSPQTVRVNQTLYFICTAYDEEDGSNADGNLTFNSSFEGNVTVFEVNETTGVVNYTAQDNETGNYNVTICATDQGIPEPENSSFCGNNHFPKTDCDTFTLSVLEVNNPPEIISYYPNNTETLIIEETESIYFNVSATDPDNTTLTIYWYANNILKDSHFGDEDEYTFSTTYGDAGDYIIMVVATDGEDNDSVSWNVTVLPKELPVTPSGAAGGGERLCKEMWRCTMWAECQNISELLDFLPAGHYKYWADKCSRLMIGEKISFWQCGIQTRSCVDFAKCNTFAEKPSELMACVLVPPPSCFDKIRNCHHGACEILVDCGGPCKPCPIQVVPPRYKPRILYCGDKICHITEIFTCLEDCYMFWILWVVALSLILIIVIKVRQSKKKKKTRRVKEKEKVEKKVEKTRGKEKNKRIRE